MRTTTWGKLKAVLEAQGVTIEAHGSEKKLTKPLPGGKKLTYVLQHECCRSSNSDVWATHLSRIKSKFGITDADFRR